MSEPRSLLDARALLESAVGRHLLGSLTSADLNVNIMSFQDNAGIDEHVNNAVDVLIVAIDGTGVVHVDGEEQRLSAGQAMIIPKGAARAINADGDRFTYLTCHGRRPGLMPTPGGRPRS